MTEAELDLINDQDELLRYEKKLYRFIGMLGVDYIFSDIITNNVIALNRNTILTKGKIAFRDSVKNI